ncbi:hypothetical protein NDU88_000769 [Pleurodeles waltl]|uniref:Uncharacterized protein n=1 Tax=Pleurodeles waltl TaxID=8319 RepID=A0AAV7RAR6_PLEWA|nr:hypothetical protein NDU88_000769 [Pleurodeles waltl]
MAEWSGGVEAWSLVEEWQSGGMEYNRGVAEWSPRIAVEERQSGGLEYNRGAAEWRPGVQQRSSRVEACGTGREAMVQRPTL